MLLRARISAGEVVGGQFMPSVRELARVHGVSKLTAGRALKMLEKEGLVVSQPRRGYQVLAAAGDPDKGLPLAYVFTGSYEVGSGSDDAFAQRCRREFENAAAARGWSLLIVRFDRERPEEAVNQLRSARVCGAILDNIEPALVARLAEIGMPWVLIDNLAEDLAADAVVQDGAMGGVQAAGYMARRGHKRLAVLSPEVEGSDPQIPDRLGGVMGGLARAGADLGSVTRVEAPLGRPEEAKRIALKLLKGARRPTGIIAPWQDLTAAVAEAADELGLKIGKDFDLVGWCSSEEFQAGLLKRLPGGAEIAVVTWSIAEMAELAVAQLMQRRANPRLPAAHLRVRTHLRLSQEEEE
jgi:LacI family transcriptional regulator